MDLLTLCYCVWEIILGFISWEIKSYFLENKVAYVLEFGECGKKENFWSNLNLHIFDEKVLFLNTTHF